jgi:hypothetical protein
MTGQLGIAAYTRGASGLQNAQQGVWHLRVYKLSKGGGTDLRTTKVPDYLKIVKV